VCFDGALSHEQLAGDLRVGSAGGNQVGHAALGGGQDRPGSRRSGMCAHAAEFVPDAIFPLRGTEALEGRQGGLEELHGLALVPRPPVNLSGGQQRPCLLEWHRQPRVDRERGIE